MLNHNETPLLHFKNQSFTVFSVKRAGVKILSIMHLLPGLNDEA